MYIDIYSFHESREKKNEKTQIRVSHYLLITEAFNVEYLERQPLVKFLDRKAGIQRAPSSK